MAKNVLIVESPAKAKTIKKYLGKDFTVLASYGHVRDLVPKEGAVEPDHDFAMHYEPIEKNAKHVEAIEKALSNADVLYLATDPDREGEAISWHLCELIKSSGEKKLKDKPVYRVIFHQITKKAVQDAIAHPRDIAMDLVNAQQARRALDYLVGFNLSPLLWRKVRPGLSAGRVQSPALRMIAEREAEIEAFKSQEYWSVLAHSESDKQPFLARLTQYQDKKVEQFTITHEKQADKVISTIKKDAKGQLTVVHVEKKQRKRNPPPPFITSTLQQEASRKLGFTTRRTMQIAQQLYEGVELGDEGHVGLITYMRTDSVSLANEALDDIRGHIVEHYGKENLPDQARHYKTKSKNAQEAHEAIRPTSMHYTPEHIKKVLSAEQLRLYQLIWKRTVACQMVPARIDTVAVDFSAGAKHRFRANGSTVTFPGFLSVYEEGRDDVKKTTLDDDSKQLPPLKEGQTLAIKDIVGEQHFTEPPPRYTEASLVKALEEHDIGRPSTYASIIFTLKQRRYVELDKKRFIPTDVGRVVARFLTEYFTSYVDYDFTAGLEDALDEIARGEKEWIPMLDHFWQPFKDKVADISEHVSRKDVTHEAIDEKCPECGEGLSIRLGRNGRFIGCDAYPQCKYTRSLNPEEDEEQKKRVEGRKCPDCSADLTVKRGRYGPFIGCSAYPDCRHIESLNPPKDTQVSCPECKQGHMLERRSRRGKIFYSCARYPKCKYAVWDQPINEACPTCHWPMLTLKTTKKRGTEKKCPQKECDYQEPIS